MEPVTQDAKLLIQTLYDPARSMQVEQIQSRLHSIQKSDLGWEVAEDLLDNEDQNVRFFGALTYTVKLNQEGASLKQEDLLAIVDRLLKWAIYFVDGKEGPLVLQKICSTLVVLFVLPNVQWTHCIRQVMCSLLVRRPASEDDLKTYPTMMELVSKLNMRQLAFAFTFCNILATDGARVDHESPKFHSSHQRISANIVDSAELMRQGFTDPRMSTGEYRDMVLQCFQAWVNYTKLQHSASSEPWQTLQGLLEPAARLLFSEETFQAAATFFVDVLVDFGEFLSQDSIEFFYNLFNSPWAANFRQRFQTDDIDEDVSAFGQLTLSFGRRVPETLTNATARSEQFMELIHEITKSQRYENVEQNLSNAIVDFWEMFVLDATPGDDSEHNGHDGSKSSSELVKQHSLLAIDELTQAIILPITDQNFVKLGTDHPLAEFRFRVSDVIEAAYVYIGSDVIQVLIANVVNASSSMSQTSDQRKLMENFALLEANFYCLGAIPHSMSYEAKSIESKSLEDLFASPIYASILRNNSLAPIKLQKILVRVIGQYHQFLGRHENYLLKVLEVLFHCLDQVTLMNDAASVVFRLCNHNRHVLISQLDQFLEASEKFFHYTSASDESKQQMAGAVSSIIQSLPSERDKILPLSTLLGQIERDYTSLISLAADDSELRHKAVEKALNELKRVADGFRELETDTIDLETATDEQDASFWSTGEGSGTQLQIIHFLEILAGPFQGDGTVLELVCDILRAGYRETKAGPFVFPTSFTVNFIATVNLQNPRFDVALQTATAFVASQASKRDSRDPALASMLRFALTVVKALQDPEKDPDIAYYAVDLISRFIPSYLDLFSTAITEDEAAEIFTFTVQCFEIPSPLPKQSASSLWKMVIDSTSQSITNATENVKLPNLLVNHLGPRLVRAIIFGVAGNAARSETDVLVEPLKKLVFKEKQQLVKSWLDGALFSSDFPSQRVEDAAKRQFCAQVLGLRGARKTNSIMKEFALACRGLSAGYG